MRRRPRNPRQPAAPSTGYWVARAHRGRGYVTAALQALTVWAFELDEVERLQLYVEPWNRASWQAAERCGFQREGLLRSWQQIGGTRKDMYVYSRTRQDPTIPTASS
ncbi:MAG: GNAT family N-acetyltransferase [Arthrobacter sp.]|nr:GNAT family N-acetyltransferase [Arthrobacter sp.]